MPLKMSTEPVVACKGLFLHADCMQADIDATISNGILIKASSHDPACFVSAAAR